MPSTLARARRAARYAARWLRHMSGLERPGVVYIIDSFHWALGEVGALFEREVRRFGWPPFHLTDEVHAHYGKVVHFASQFMLNGGRHRAKHPSNRLVFTFYHGDRSDPEPAMQAMFRELPRALEHVDLVTVSCEEGLRNMLAAGWPRERIVPVPLGVELDRFAPCTAEARRARRAELGIPEGAFAIGSFQKDGVGWGDGMEPKLVKGPDVWVAALEKYQAERGNAFAVLLGPARGYVKAQLEKRGIPYAHRRVERMADTAPFYDALDAYLIASRSEGGPLALLEAMGKGVPVVSTRMGMPADVLADGTGRLAELEDAAGLAAHLIALSDDAEGARRMVAAARSKVEENYSWPAVTRRMVDEAWRPLLATL